VTTRTTFLAPILSIALTGAVALVSVGLTGASAQEAPKGTVGSAAKCNGGRGVNGEAAQRGREAPLRPRSPLRHDWLMALQGGTAVEALPSPV
jgi:hypothetical protein